MNALLIDLFLNTPVLISGVANGEENSVRTLPYIPGSAIRGALVARYKTNQPDLLMDKRAVSLFFSGSVSFLNAYPSSENNYSRSLPFPLCWRMRKEDEVYTDPVVNLTNVRDPAYSEHINKRFISVEPDITKHYTAFDPEEELAIHIASQERGRVSEDSDLFQYQSLARTQHFTAVITSENVNELKELEKLLVANNQLFLGRSRSAGYGHVRINQMEIKPDWREYTSPAAGKSVSLTLLSDALLRDEFGQPTHDMDAYLSHRFGKSFHRTQAFIQPGVVGGFNRKWGLPLPQHSILGMGSVFVYPEDSFTQQELGSISESGVGDRRVDGYGRIAVNWLEESKISLSRYQSPRTPAPKTLSTASEKLARTMAERILIRRLNELLLAKSLKITITGEINNHQLSRLRSVVRKCINQETADVQPVQSYLQELRSNARNQLERARVMSKGAQRGPRLSEWLQDRLSSEDGLTEVGFKSPMIPEVAGIKVQLTENLKREYTLRYIEMVVDGKMKLNRKEVKS